MQEYPTNDRYATGSVHRQVDSLLRAAPAYSQLDAGTQAELREALLKVSGYMAQGNMADPLAVQMAGSIDDLRSRMGGGSPGSPSGSAQPPRSTPPGAGTPPPATAPAGAAPSSGSGAADRAAGATRAMISAIDFPGFVASLIQGTFQAIVDASIQQMEAYAQLVKNVSGTVDQFMNDHVSEGSARDYLADKYDGFLQRDTSGARPKLRVHPEAQKESAVPSFFEGLGFSSPSEIDDQSMDSVVVPAARREMAEQRQQTLAVMVMMGINRILVDKGEITAKLQFHIDATEAMTLRFDQKKTTNGNLGAKAGRQPFNANAIMVNTTSLNAQNDLNLRADLTGQVKVEFRSEAFPLERFADSAAIQLVNSRAKVPQPMPPAAAVPPGVPTPVPPAVAPVNAAPVAAAPVPAAPSGPIAAAPVPAAPPPANRAPAAQSVSSGVGNGYGNGRDNGYSSEFDEADPWLPRNHGGHQ